MLMRSLVDALRAGVRARGAFAYANEATWRRSERVAYYFLARGMWKQSSWYCKLLAIRFMAIYVAMTLAVLLIGREIRTLHDRRSPKR